jgi:hypothetical protein
MKELIKILTDLIANNFYGKVTISFENGNMTLVRQEQTIKLKKEQP